MRRIFRLQSSTRRSVTVRLINRSASIVAVTMGLTWGPVLQRPLGSQTARPTGRIVLEPIPLRGIDSLLPETDNLAVAIDATGAVLWFESQNAEWLGTLIGNTTGAAHVVRFGRRGKGPGELQNPWFVSLSEAGAMVYEPSGRRLIRYARDGKLISDQMANLAVGITDASLLSMSSDHEQLVGISPSRGTRLGLSRSGDTIWQRLRANVLGGDEPFASAMRGDTVYFTTVVGGELFRLSPRAHAIAFGARVPPRLRNTQEVDALLKQMSRGMRGPRGEIVRPTLPPDARKRAATQPVRQTSPITGLQIDGSGRLWRFRDASTGPVADVFADTTLVQRVALPCAPLPRGVRIAGNWMILACLDSRPDSDRDVIMHRFRF